MRRRMKKPPAGGLIACKVSLRWLVCATMRDKIVKVLRRLHLSTSLRRAKEQTIDRVTEPFFVRHIRDLFRADPVEGDYCLLIQRPFLGYRYKGKRELYCTERLVVGHPCRGGCRFGHRAAANRTRAAAIQAAKQSSLREPA